MDPQDPLLAELERETCLMAVNPRMLSGHLQGSILSVLSKMIQPSSILEIGTYTGYSAICLAQGLAPGGRLITIEINDELRDFAAKYFRKAGLQAVIDQRTGDARDIIPRLHESFDLIYMDGDKREYAEYFRLVFDTLKKGGWLLADNTLWDGKVLGEESLLDRQTAGIVEFNRIIAEDNRIDKVILPLRDGLTVIRKK